MRICVSIITNSKTKDAEAQQTMKKAMEGFVVALSSGNQLVVREACISIARMTKVKPISMKGAVGKLLQIGWELLDVQVPLIPFSAHQCLRSVIRFVPDNSDNLILRTIIQGTTLKDYPHVQRSCYDCLNVIIQRPPNPAATPTSPTSQPQLSNEVLTKTTDVVIDGLQSAEKEVLEMVFKCLSTLEVINAEKSSGIIKKYVE